MKDLQALILCIFLLLPLAVGHGAEKECTCVRGHDDHEEHDESEALKYKVGAIIAILIASAIGVCIPMLGKVFPALKPETTFFFIVKAFAAGVILATALIHILPEAYESLTSPCLNENPWGKFPFTGFIMMLSAIGTLLVDTLATSYYARSQKAQTQPHNHEGDEESNDNDKNAVIPSSEVLRERVITQVLELGIVVHSIIIGITLGVSKSPETIRPLMVALIFHQLFEGVGLGGCISQARFKLRTTIIMGLFFSLTTPVGIAIGAGISNTYDENSPKALIIQGVLNAASAGILIYMSLVDLLAADFMSTKMQGDRKLQLGANASLLVGAACMSVLAKWA